jgi:hypothetical protein
MARRRKSAVSGDWLFPNLTTGQQVEERSSLLDVLDNVLNRGLMVNGDLVLGVANVDLIYVKLSVLLAALDKVTKNDPVFKPVAAGPTRKRRR